MGAVRLSCLALVVGAAIAAPMAHADVIAAVDLPGSGTDSSGCPVQSDLAIIDAATGARTPLPTGINTSADEVHPSINAFGTRLIYARVDPTDNTTQVIGADLGTGQQSQLFSLFDEAQMQPNTPSLAPDGSVITGGPLQPATGSQFKSAVTLTSLANFPSGPFSHTARATNASFSTNGATSNPVERSDGLIVSGVTAGTNNATLVLDTGNGSFKHAHVDNTFLAHPAFSGLADNVVVFMREGGSEPNGRLDFRPVPTFGSSASTELPAVINPDGFDELDPAFTSDGRYLGFLRYDHHSETRHMRLFVFDTQTQLMLNSNGLDLGVLPSFGCRIARTWPGQGAISLRETFQLKTITFGPFNQQISIAFQLMNPTGIGILVQRVAGKHRLFGRLVPRLVTVGRVPFGQFKRGRHKVRWNFRVNGRRLRRGTYLVTPRLLTGRGVVHELGKPHLMRVH
jgi:hypothetical protein